MDLRIPLVLAAVLFAIAVGLRVRPRFGGRARPSQALRDAKDALARATTDEARIEALAAAGDACAALVGRGGSAVGYYLRAMRLAPTSLALLERACLALAEKPLSLEALLWRRLAVDEWTDAMRPVIREVARRLEVLYRESALRRRLRARAFATLHRALGGTNT